MGRPRKLSPQQVEQAATDRRNGMSWSKLSSKYKCAINTIRTALAEHSDEFLPKELLPKENDKILETQLTNAIDDINKIKKALKKQFNLHI